jgi:hypothetical protein
MHDVGVRQDLGTRHGITVHSVGMMFVQLGKLGLDPLITFRALETSSASVLLAVYHVGRVRCGDEENRFIQVPAVNNVVNDMALVESDLKQRGMLVGRSDPGGNERQSARPKPVLQCPLCRAPEMPLRQ